MAIPLSPFGTEPGRFLLDDLGCTGDESNVAECRHLGLGSHNCKDRRDEQAAVICGTTRGICISYPMQFLCLWAIHHECP